MKNLLRWFAPTLIGLLLVTVPVLLAGGGDADAGKAVYDKKCASCHGKTGEGNPAIAKSLKVELRDLGAKEVQAKSDDDLKKAIVEGPKHAKPVKELPEADMANVLAYLRTLAKK